MRMMPLLRHLALAVGALLLLFGGSAPAHAQPGVVLFVDAAAAGAGDGSSWADAFPDLQAALAVAAPGDEVWVAEGTYRPTDGGPDAGDRTVSFRLPSGVALYGGFDGTETKREQRDWSRYATVLSGDVGVAGDSLDNSYHVVVAEGVDSTTVLDGVTVEQGNGAGPTVPNDRGAGLYAPGASLTLRNCIVRRNRIGFPIGQGEKLGGGVYVEDGSPLIEDCLFESNRANAGAGFYASGGAPVLRRVTFRDNRAASVFLGDGADALIEDALFEGGELGALYVRESSPVVRRTTFRDNTLDGDGPAARIEGAASAPRFEDCLFEGNTGLNGGGIFSQRFAAPVVVRSVFRNNTVVSNGGGATIQVGEALFLDCRFEGNEAGSASALYFKESSGAVIGSAVVGNRATFPAFSGALNAYLPPRSGAPLLIANTLVAGNTGVRGGGFHFDYTGEVHVVNTAVVGNAADVAGGGLYLSETLGTPIHLTNVTVAANTAAETGGGLYIGGGWGTRLENAILWGNEAPGRAEVHVEWGTPPAAERAIIEGGCPIAVNCTGVEDADPLFVRPPSPGPDGAWGTADDDYGDLRLREGSPAVDAGLASLLPADRWDLDGDGDTEEPIPIDLDGRLRVQGMAPDLGAYESAFAVGAEDEPAPITEPALSVSPNPGRGVVTVRYRLAGAGAVRLAVFDVLGREVALLADAVQAAGEHEARLGRRGLAAGVYLVRLEVGTGRAAEVLTQRVTLLR